MGVNSGERISVYGRTTEQFLVTIGFEESLQKISLLVSHYPANFLVRLPLSLRSWLSANSLF
jgi:hypothetical protein